MDRSNQILITVLILDSIALAVSSILDLWLWLSIGYLVPSWTISAISIGSIGLAVGLISMLATKDHKSTKGIQAGPRPEDS